MAEESDQQDVSDPILWTQKTRDARKQLEAERLAEARELYSNEAGAPVLRRSFAVYLDALGTSVATQTLDDVQLRKQIELLDRFRWFLHDDEWKSGYERFLSFSDNVVLGSPAGQELPGGEGLGMLLGSIVAYQLNLTARGRFLRGGIALGDLYMDDRFVTGSALVEAVLLEEEVAVYPRVVLSGACVQLAIDDLDAYNPSWQSDSPWDSELLVDADGVAFINYLVGIAADGIPGQIEEGLRAHRDVVTDMLQQFAERGRIREKYLWVAHYHNFVCAEFFPDHVEYSIERGLKPVEERYPRQFHRFVPRPA